MNNNKFVAKCREAALKFACANSFEIKLSNEFRLDRKDFASTPWPFTGLPVVYVAFSDDGRALFAGLSHDCSGQYSYFKNTPDGRGTVKKNWAEGNPDFLVFYCLHEKPVQYCAEPYHTRMLELRRIFNAIIRGMHKTVYASVAELVKSVPMEDIFRHFPWFRGSSQVNVFESWKNALMEQSSKPMTETEGYYLKVFTEDLGDKLKAAIIRTPIMSMDDPTVHVQLEQTKDISFVSRLPVYIDSDKLEPVDLVLHIITRLSNINLLADEDE